jgi:glycosyltransferase involved in cell wall biosynthesis
MSKNTEIAILLPGKEDYSKDCAAAASIWVKDFNRGILVKKTTIFGKAKSLPYLSKNFINLNNESLIDNSYFYLNSFIKRLPKNTKVIEIHNRPNYFFSLKKKVPNIKYILVFHNDPNLLKGSRSINEKIAILENCDKIIFASSYIKERFYYNINNYLKQKGRVIYPSTNYYNHNFNKKIKKEKIIIFVGKLNLSKGYNFFGQAVLKVLNKYKDWHVIVAGNEKREAYNFYHKRLKFYNWISHNKIINFYKKSSISIVPSVWEEPFGRTAMESSDMGNAVITSGRGGLKETSNKPIILKKVDAICIEKEIIRLIKRPKLLKKIQDFNYKNRKINYLDNLNTINSIKQNFLFKKEKIIINSSNRILHIANFDEKTHHRLFNINFANKISNGFAKNKISVINFSDRSYVKSKFFLYALEKEVRSIVANYNPNLILLGQTDLLPLSLLQEIKFSNPSLRIAFWYEDSVNKNGPDFNKNISFLEKYKSVVDQYFVTTNKHHVHASIPKNKLNYIPVPCSASTENLHLYKLKNHEFDLFFASSHGVNRGVLKRNKTDERYNFFKVLIEKSKNITYNLFGYNNISPIWGDKFFDEISKCRFGLNLSRGKPIKHYSSNRIATLIANGIPTLLDQNTKFNDFFSNNEVIFYKNIDDLVDKIDFYKKNEKARIKIGMNGKKKYFKIFNNQIVADYIVSKTLGIKPFYTYVWDQ